MLFLIAFLATSASYIPLAKPKGEVENTLLTMFVGTVETGIKKSTNAFKDAPALPLSSNSLLNALNFLFNALSSKNIS